MATDTTLIPRRGSSSLSNRPLPSRQPQIWRRQQQSSLRVVNAGPREGPSMFDSASNVRIFGGHFSTHHTPQTSVTVNIHNGAFREGNIDDNRHESQGNQNSNFVRNRPHNPPTNDNQHETQPRPVQRSNVLYEQHLLHKGRGHPLWIPQPNLRLPKPYREKGVCVGDVGIITPDGAFDFLFNICLPPEDPIHCDELPENFSPLNPPLSRTDIREFREFTYGSYLASSSVNRVQSGRQEARDLAFESSASEGAILTMPEGAHMQELNNVSKFRDYLSIHAESWYQFVNGPRGREAKNGDLRLVVGCDKSTFWGMAVFSNLSHQTNVRLEFNGRVPEQGQLLPGNAYDWHHSGTAEVRVGPDSEEIEELTGVDATTTQTLRNQCLFMRTLNVTLSDTVWEEMFPKSTNEVPSGAASTSPSKLPRFSPAAKAKPRSVKPPPSSIPKAIRRRLQDLTTLVRKRSVEVIITSSPSSSPTVHPARLLNNFLFEQFPEARMTITHDRNWYLPLQTMSPSYYDPAELITRVCRVNHMSFRDGIAYFDPINFEDQTTHHHPQVIQFSRLIDGHISLKEYLFGPDDNPDGVLDCISALMERFYVDEDPLTTQIQINDGLRSDFEDDLDGILGEMLSGRLQVVYRREEHGHRPIPSELPGHPHFFLPLSRVSIIAAKRRRNGAFDHVSEVLSSERIDSLRLQLNQLLLQPPPYSISIKPRINDTLQRLAGALYRRYITFHEKEDLDEAISYYQDIYNSTTSTSCLHLEGLLGLCASLYQRLILQGMFQDFVDLVKGLRTENALNLSRLLEPVIYQLRGPSEKSSFPFPFDDYAFSDSPTPPSTPLDILMSEREEDISIVERSIEDPSQWSSRAFNNSDNDYLKPNRRLSTKVLSKIPIQSTAEPRYSVLRRILHRITPSRRRTNLLSA